MNAFRGLAVSALMLVIATFAVPGFGAQSKNKTYALTMCVGTFDSNDVCQPNQPNPGTASTTIQALVKNTSPAQSNSTINSVDLFADLNWTIDSADPAYEESQPGVFYTPDFTSSPGHIKVTNLNPLKPQDILHLSFTVTQYSCGDGSWAQSLIWSGSNLGGNTFTLQPAVSVSVAAVSCGMLACNLINPNSFVVQPTATTCNAATDVQCVTGERWSYNKDGNACGVVPFYVSNLLSNSSVRTLHFRWPGETNAVFNYTINTPTQNVQVAWIQDPQTGNPIFVPPLQCNASNGLAEPYLPTPYGSLAADVNSSKKILKVNSSTTAVPPGGFQIVIGTEMMLVTNIANGTWTVTRGYGNTQAAPHFANDPVMSTPLPILTGAPWNTFPSTSGYSAGNHAHMCYVGTLAAGPNANGTYTTDLIDIGDGYGSWF